MHFNPRHPSVVDGTICRFHCVTQTSFSHYLFVCLFLPLVYLSCKTTKDPVTEGFQVGIKMIHKALYTDIGISGKKQQKRFILIKDTESQFLRTDYSVTKGLNSFSRGRRSLVERPVIRNVV